MGIFLVIFFVELVCIQRKTAGITHAMIRSIILWNATLFSLVQLLDITVGIHQTSVGTFYIGITLILLAGILYRMRGRELSIPKWRWRLDFYQVIVGAIALGVLIGAIILIPYNWDSMTYHLPRLASWTQFESVAPFATGIDRQVTSPVGGAYIQLVVYILSGENIRMLNLVQYSAYILNTYLIYKITERLGGKKVYNYLAAILFMSMPIAFAEATTTQVDHISALWLLCFVYLLWDFVEVKSLIWNKPNIISTVFLAATLGFGYLAKPSIGFAAALFLVSLLVICVKRKDNVLVLIKMALTALVSMGIPIAIEWFRTFVTFGSVATDNVGARQMVGTLAPNYLLINCLKNYSFNVVPILPADMRNRMISYLERFALAIGVELNHPDIAEDGRTFMYWAHDNLHCDTAVNVVIVIGASIAILLFLIFYKQFKGLQKIYIITAFASWILFCSMLRWQPFVTRYMISYLALLCPVIVIVMQQVFTRYKKFWERVVLAGVYGITAYFLIIEFQYLYRNGITYEHLGYFDSGQVELWTDYDRISNYIIEQGYDEVGLSLGADTYEFPIWRMLEPIDSEIRHVLVSGELEKYESEGFLPDCIWVTRSGVSGDIISYRNNNYVLNTELAGEYAFLYELE